jgi:NDP-sugar pyrophosphorylase family protein
LVERVRISFLAGPNVSIGKSARIGGGTRIRESIILGNSVIGEHSLILYSVIGE